MQSPNFYGQIDKINEFTGDTKEAGALFIHVYDPLSLGILASSGRLRC